MATIAATRKYTPIDGPAVLEFVWSNVNAGDTCLPLAVGDFQEVTVAFLKGSAFGGNMSLVGTLDPAQTDTSKFVTLTDAAHAPISGIAADAEKEVLQGVYQLAPIPATGASGVNVWVKLTSPRG